MRRMLELRHSSPALSFNHRNNKRNVHHIQREVRRIVWCELPSGKEESGSERWYPWKQLRVRMNVWEMIRGIPEWADAQKEQSMRKRRAYYSNEDWLRHRSSLRHQRHMASTLSSRVIISLIPPVFTVTGISLLITLYNSIVSYGVLPWIFPLLHASSLPYELTAPALALLLVFRTDTSYSRYDEARKTWTEVISSTKDLARQSTAWIQSPNDLRFKHTLLQYILAFPLALKCHLIQDSDVEEDLRDVLSERDLAFVLSSEHKPNCLIQMIFQTLNHLHLGDTQAVAMNENIRSFNASISVCERLIRTPIPLSYTRLTSRFLVVWHLALPIVLWDDCKWLVIPSTFFSASALFCIEEVGALIEEPFPILPLEKMCSVAHKHIKEMVELDDRVKKHLGVVASAVHSTNGCIDAEGNSFRALADEQLLLSFVLHRNSLLDIWKTVSRF